jgi:N-acetylglucosamine-6-phosphate deacetylase
MTLRGAAYIEGRIVDDAEITIAGGSIERVELRSGGGKAKGVIVPGFVDVHVHGGAGADFMDATGEAVREVARFHLRHGTTSLAATTLSAASEAITDAIRAVRRHEPQPDEAAIVAIHFEGPYLQPAKCGAQDPASLRAANRDELLAWIDEAGELPLVMTIAPEVEGALELIGELAGRVVFSIGHTAATLEISIAALERGARHFTHLFNAMPPLHHREPGPVAAALGSKATAELIADTLHLHPAVLSLAARSLGGRAVLVTDAMRACGMPEGSYRLYRHEVTVSGGAARLRDGTLAGSVLTMDAAVRNMVSVAGIDLEDALRAATSTPAALVGAATKGRIAAGLDADLVVLDDDLTVARVIARGEEVDRG